MFWRQYYWCENYSDPIFTQKFMWNCPLIKPKEVNPILSLTQYLHFKYLCHRSMEIYAVQKNRHCLVATVQQCFNSIAIFLWIIWKLEFVYKNRSKWTSAEVFLWRFSAQLVELPLVLRTHIGSCFQSVHEAAVGRIFAKHLGKLT